MPRMYKKNVVCVLCSEYVYSEHKTQTTFFLFLYMHVVIFGHQVSWCALYTCVLMCVIYMRAL